jgi:hypothetical protein
VSYLKRLICLASSTNIQNSLVGFTVDKNKEFVVTLTTNDFGRKSADLTVIYYSNYLGNAECRSYSRGLC